MNYELHIDLLRCEHCSQHNKLLEFCSACGRARTKVIVVPMYEHKKDVQAPYRCPVCYSQRHLSQKCVYCDLKMPVNRNCDGWLEKIPWTTAAKRAAKPRWGNAKKREVKKAAENIRRTTEQRYVDGVIRYVYVDNGEVVDQPKPLKPAIKSKYMEPTPKRRTLVYRRDGGCIRCGKNTDLSLHHIKHRADKGSNLPSNLQTLCRQCHAYVHEVLKVPSGTPYAHSLELDPLTQEEEDAQWIRIRRKRAAEKGKKDSNYTYGKSLATNMAAPEIARLRKNKV